MLQITSAAKRLPKLLPKYPLPFLSRKMTKDATANAGPSSSIEDFRKVLKSSTRVLALCGAGLSAASGLDTFRGAGGMWRNHRATTLATPEAFRKDPGLVWLFYSYRRHRALHAQPNPGHFALAELAGRMEGFVCLTQNVDGLSQRASHPRSSLKLLHGTLFDIKCFSPSCDYIEKDNYDDPIVPALAISSLEDDERLAASKTDVKATAAYIDPNTPTTTIPADQLPHCPKCKTGLLRPGVVWFGEALPEDTIQEVDNFLNEGPISLMLVIGTSATVYPAAGFIAEAREKGARVAVVNFDGDNLGAASGLKENDFLFVGDSGEILPKILGVE